MICPTKPADPIPDPVALLVIFKKVDEIGPRIALEIIAGSQITGFFIILGIWSIDVPTPCASNPPNLFSL